MVFSLEKFICLLATLLMERSRERSQPGDYGCGIICLARGCGAFSAISKCQNKVCVRICLCALVFVCTCKIIKACII